MVERLRLGIRDRVVSHLAGDEPLDTERFTTGDAGLFGRNSVAWLVHADPSMLVGGLQALLLQTLHPLVMAGVAEHSDYQVEPWSRLRRTSKFIATVTYGSTDEALRIIEIVEQAHRHVVGITADGRPYDANDPSLLAWVHGCEVWGFWTAFEAFSPLSAGVDGDQYVSEMAALARAMGISDPPERLADITAYFAQMEPELRAGPSTRDLVDFLASPPTPRYARGPSALVTAGAVGLLPAWARLLHDLPAPRALDPWLVGPAARRMLRTLGWVLGTSPHREAALQRTQS